MTKAYFLPVLLAAVGTIFFNLKQTSGNNTVIPAKAGIRSPIKSGMTKITTRTEIKFSIGCIIVFIIILLPSLIFAPHDIFRDIITYSLSRPQGLSKTNIAWFFIMHDLLLATGGIYAIVTLRRNRMYGLVCLLTIFLFIFYQDFYYLYFNVALPYLCLSFIGLYHFLNKRFSFTHAIGMTVLIPFFLFSFFVYMKTYHHIQQIPNTDQVVSAIKQRHPPYIYGTESIVTAFAYLSHTPLLDNVIDTNDTLFRKGFLDKSKLTADAIRTKALIVTEGVMISEQGVTADILGDAFDVPQIVKHCHNVLRIPVTTEGYINRINLFSC